MAITNTQLVNYAKGQLGRMYTYGTYGQLGSEQVYKEVLARYPDKIGKWPKYTYVEGYGQKWHDCAGLIKGACWCNGEIDGLPKYDSRTDRSANGLIDCCVATGNADTVPEIPGLIMWKPGHVGVYVGNGVTCEAKGHKYGVVLTTSTAWQLWGKLPKDYVIYEDKPQPGGDTCMVELPILKRGMKDTNGSVTSWQGLMRLYNYKDDSGALIEVDGSFGPKCEQGTKNVQKKHNLPQTGIVDAATWRALIV